MPEQDAPQSLAHSSTAAPVASTWRAVAPIAAIMLALAFFAVFTDLSDLVKTGVHSILWGLAYLAAQVAFVSGGLLTAIKSRASIGAFAVSAISALLSFALGPVSVYEVLGLPVYQLAAATAILAVLFTAIGYFHLPRKA